MSGSAHVTGKGGQDRRGRAVGGLGAKLSGIVVALGCLLFLGGFAWGAVRYQPYAVPTDSMSPTVPAGDKVLADRIDGTEVHRGDVVVFTDTAWADMPLVKRVVGIGGDTVACCDAKGRLTVNGKAVDEPYVVEGGLGGALGGGAAGAGRASDVEFSTTVPSGKLFLLGDRRSTSVDSRSHLTDAGRGTVDASAVTGRVDGIAWPMGDWRMLPVPTGFAGLPGGISEPGPLRPVLGSILAGALLIFGGAAYEPAVGLAGRRRKRKERSLAAV
jgi:signal peptidase I